MTDNSTPVLVYKNGISEPISEHSSIKEAAKIYFKGTRQGQRFIFKSCTGERKSPIEHDTLGKLRFKYKIKQNED